MAQRQYFSAVLLALGCALAADPALGDWTPADSPLATRWAVDVRPDSVLPEYPRPQMVRQDWMNLNGLWEYAIRPKAQGAPAAYDGQILVPFPIESALSGVKKTVGAGDRLWMRRTFAIPAGWRGRSVLLHFGAVDWEAKVWVNGQEIGEHRGGFDPFFFDIASALKPEGPQELVASIWDPTDAGGQPRGKQVRQPHGIWYTSVTGVWQTVWLEPVPRARIERLVLEPDLARGILNARAECAGARPGDIVRFAARDGQNLAAEAEGPAGDAVELAIENPKPWSPDSPFLYDLDVSLLREGSEEDSVRSYFGLRDIRVEKDERGVPRLALNGKIGFQYGPLDQGWQPDGLYTAASDQALVFDIEMTKRMGFNMIRKHVKVEPARWYYHCDRLGILVWQDMPSASRPKESADAAALKQRDAQFESELMAMVDCFRNHPSIVVWVPFNEGWGQYDSKRISAWLQEYDPNCLVNHASGWNDEGAGDLKDQHSYPFPKAPAVENERASVQGEFGGLGWPVEGHLWWDKRNWGYRTYSSREELAENYRNVIERLREFQSLGLSAGVYTQTTDVEGEVNGLMTYDREVIKLDADWLAGLNQRLYLPPPTIETVLETSEQAGQRWRYTTEKPVEDWASPDFDDSSWQEGEGVFGTAKTPGAKVRTIWNTPEIWLRRAFPFEGDAEGLRLTVLHDEDAEIYLNGELAAAFEGHTGSYVGAPIREAALAALRQGTNTLAAHCRQTTGGQSIDAGLRRVTEAP
ncbi:MAG: Beta-galactosidase [candidate division BRC1 bacterium ADurb.BinA364]|nr:MAG: Beta-galactosidase [candidate division BRC1 bacterium ADurb.BinA364]